jgi:GH43 family beta-xylosidase
MQYENPVWHEYFADPYILKAGQTYYAYGTGATPLEGDGRAFPVLRSQNLVNWEYLGGSLTPTTDATAFWAPEVAEEGGRFYMYYSAATGGGDESHRIRIAVADQPQGPFVDSGRVLMPDFGFSIDASPFKDPRDGTWYLFFAHDYLQDEPHGTGIGVVRLKDMFTPDTEPKMVNRALAEWQVYEKNRDYKGKVWPAWYTVEGPFVLYRHERYWCLYSGGRWSSERYGVGFAVADHPLGPWKDDFAVHGPVVLKGIPDKIIGPGHNSVTIAPDGRSDVIVYHAWDRDLIKRRMCIDPLIWTKDGPRCDGPSTGPRVFNEWREAHPEAPGLRHGALE